MSKILVTGGAGFIGSHLCEKLATNKENEVYSIDNYFTGSVSNHVENVTYIACNTKDIAKMVDFKPDIVYHLGEYSRVEQSFEDIELVWDFNKQGTFAVLEFCRKHNSKLVYSGSSTKFADMTDGYIQSPYAWTKMTNTELVKNYGLWYGLDYAITYFYNVYGKREISAGKYATLIGIFREKMLRGETLSVVAPGTQKRNFTHIDDIIAALVLIGKHGKGDEYGIGNLQEFTVKEIAEMFGGKIDMIEERRGNRMSAKVITDKTKLLGWEAKHNLNDYINTLKINGWKIPN